MEPLPDPDLNPDPNHKEESIPPQASVLSLTPEKLQGIWNEAADLSNVKNCRSLNNSRKTKAKARIREAPEESTWQEVISRIRDSGFCNGDNERGWCADFDFLIKPNTYVKVLEGAYGGKSSKVIQPFKYTQPKESAGDRQVRKMKEDWKKKTDGGANNTSGCNEMPNSNASPSTKDGAGNKSARNQKTVAGGSPTSDHIDKAARTNLRVSPQDPGPTDEDEGDYGKSEINEPF
jgi:hypothetical protein